MNAETIERLKKDEASLADAPWCEMWLSMGIRHLSRNCDLDCPNDDPYHDCGYPGRYDGSALARIRNELPALLAAAEERDAARAEAERLRRAIESEPELPDDMPDGMFAAFRTMDREEMEEALRMLVRLTKKCILERAALAEAKGGGA